MNKEEKQITKEIRREFQLERIVLFSDAVFAIVITLMAIEIRLPELPEHATPDDLAHALLHLVPTAVAYAASFLFIGFTWYQHLQIFSLLKDYDKGLVVRNLTLLFFMGFFPFGVSLVASHNEGLFAIIIIYFSIIVLCKAAQLRLHHYILVKRPQLRFQEGFDDEIRKYKRSRLVMVLLVVMFFLVSTTMYMIPNPDAKPMAWWWFFFFPLLLKLLGRKYDKPR
jgi:uncharacterized membrane protein